MNGLLNVTYMLLTCRIILIHWAIYFVNLNGKWLSDHLVYRALNSWIFDATNLVNFGKSSDLVLPQFSVYQHTNMYDCLTSVFCTKQTVVWWLPLFFLVQYALDAKQNLLMYTGTPWSTQQQNHVSMPERI